MRLGLSLSAATAMCLAFAACGDDDAPPSQATTSGTGGEGAQGGQGGQGGTGGEEPTTPELRADGDPCEDGEQCRSGFCLTEEYSGWAGGYCSRLCEPELAPCDAGSECLFQGAYSLCLRSCDEAADCTGEARECVDMVGDDTLLCVGGCTADDQCQVACDDDAGFCSSFAEACDNAADDDEDGLQDCEELDCSGQKACTDAIAAACAGATDVSAGGTFTGTTEQGTNLFGTFCSGRANGAGENEKIFRFTAPAKGAFHLGVTAREGEFRWYLRADCDDASTLLGCADSDPPGSRPMEILVDEGDAYVLFIEGTGGVDAQYQVDMSFAEQICGDGARVGEEECDDGNAVDDDVCSSECVVNAEAACALATPLTGTVETTGDTSEATQDFSGSCGGAGGEIVYRYTPEADGEVTITATPVGSADVVLYVRSACADPESETECWDDLDPEAAESMTMEVTAGEPIDIVVDSYSSGSSGAFTLTIAPAAPEE